MPSGNEELLRILEEKLGGRAECGPRECVVRGRSEEGGYELIVRPYSSAPERAVDVFILGSEWRETPSGATEVGAVKGRCMVVNGKPVCSLELKGYVPGVVEELPRLMRALVRAMSEAFLRARLEA